MADDLVVANNQSPEPEPPTKPTVDEASLHGYFESIRDSFRETREGMEKEDKGTNGLVILFFVLSLIPLFPFIGYTLAKYYLGSALLPIKTFQIHVASFWFWWVALFLLSLGILLLALKLGGVSAAEKKKWLSPPQMRFAFSYSVVEEIQKFRTNQMSRHIDAAVYCFDKASSMLLPRRAVPTELYAAHGKEAVITGESAGLVRVEFAGLPKWYRLQPETERILKAFGEFSSKLRDRLKDCKDLPALQSALTYLAAYYYFETNSESEVHFEQGMVMLLTFAGQLDSLPPYRSEEQKKTPKEKLSIKFFSALSKVTAPFGHENPMIAFLCWLVLLFCLFSGGFYLALRFTSLRLDSTILNALIGGPILGAVTAVTIPRISKSRRD